MKRLRSWTMFAICFCAGSLAQHYLDWFWLVMGLTAGITWLIHWAYTCKENYRA